MRRLLAAAALVAAVLSGTVAASAEPHDGLDRQKCEEIGNWWAAWATGMGSTHVCWDYGTEPVEVTAATGQDHLGGWFWHPRPEINVVVDGDVSWEQHVFAHEYAHAWSYRVLGPYELHDDVAAVAGFRTWDEEAWADTFSYCLGWYPPQLQTLGQWVADHPGSPVPTPERCYDLNAAWLLPPTAPRGFQPQTVYT